MQSSATTVKEYLESVQKERQEAFSKLRKTILDNLPKGFVEEMNYGMIGYVIPHEVYPDGYHCDPKMPLPFANIASQKHFIGFYHMGIYSMPKLLSWFEKEYPKHTSLKLDMGKSCVRFKKPEKIPFDLIGELISKVSAKEWIAFYEREVKKK